MHILIHLMQIFINFIQILIHLIANPHLLDENLHLFVADPLPDAHGAIETRIFLDRH